LDLNSPKGYERARSLKKQMSIKTGVSGVAGIKGIVFFFFFFVKNIKTDRTRGKFFAPKTHKK